MSDRDGAVRELVEGFLGLSDCVAMRGHEPTVQEIEFRLRTFVAELAAERDRALGEGARLREAVAGLDREAIVLSESYLGAFEHLPEDESLQGWDKSRWVRLLAASKNAKATLASAPLSKLAGEVIGAALEKMKADRVKWAEIEVVRELHEMLLRLSPTESRFEETVDALRDELAKGGEGDDA